MKNVIKTSNFLKVPKYQNTLCFVVNSTFTRLTIALAISSFYHALQLFIVSSYVSTLLHSILYYPAMSYGILYPTRKMNIIISIFYQKLFMDSFPPFML